MSPMVGMYSVVNSLWQKRITMAVLPTPPWPMSTTLRFGGGEVRVLVKGVALAGCAEMERKRTLRRSPSRPSCAFGV